MADKELSLKEILYKIKVENDNDYYYELLNNKKIRGLIYYTLKYYKYNREYIKSLIESSLLELTWRDYIYNENYTEANYIAFIKHCLPQKTAKLLKADRPKRELYFNLLNENKLLSTVDEQFEKINDKDAFESIIEDLTEDEQYILRKIYRDSFTEQEVANELGINRIMVHRIKQYSLNKLKN